MIKKSGIYYPRTTVQQRTLLFKTWEETGDIDTACQVANVSRRTFYHWKPRFSANGYPGLAEYESRAPKNPRRTSAEIAQMIIKLRQEHPDWGKERIAKKLADQINTPSAVSPNTVKRILEDAGLWQRTIK